jgi:hypothetical protein
LGYGGIAALAELRRSGVGLLVKTIAGIGSLDRLIEREYREQCSARIADLILYVENYLGVGRIYIP